MTIPSPPEASSVRPRSPRRASFGGRIVSNGPRLGRLGLAVALIAALQTCRDLRAVGPAPREGIVEDSVGALKGPDAEARSEAARSLGAMGSAARAAAPALVEALGDADAMVRVRAATALVRVGGPQKAALPVLLTARDDPDDGVRSEAESAWGQIGAGVRATLPYVLEMLRRNDAQAQQKAVAAFGKNGLDAVPALVDALALEHTTASRLGMSIVSSTPAFGNFSRSSSRNNAQIQANTRLRTLAIEALGKLGPDLLPTLLAAMKVRDASIREGAAQALGALGPEAEGAVPALVRALGDRDAWVRQRSVEALATAAKASPVALEALVKALGHKDTMVRRAVVQALAPAVIGRSRIAAGMGGMTAPIMMEGPPRGAGGRHPGQGPGRPLDRPRPDRGPRRPGRLRAGEGGRGPRPDLPAGRAVPAGSGGAPVGTR